ncbi:hypothetical protein DS2_15864 [Catenovulum agarivorans DS-2]|uniref:Outer membrane protein beta-barrel domain-containing protein n=1 Tax=Catenovulum agarivorans DS-2 TaxID=1328313 RepID=W7QTH3_9ALTE|nr:outer membrane beta-barrel protein [Catenovulum agarivorans]EWH08725.1 hypothetical protein DS2_15864 [Catenovulum agarivorans DS-2]
MFKKSLLALALSFTSIGASANWVGGVNYASFNEDVGIGDVNVKTLNLELGYKYNTSEQFKFIPSLRFGFGIDNDNIDTYWGSFEFAVDQYYVLTIRGQYEYNSGIYLYAAPSFGSYKLSLNDHSENKDEFAYGAGIGFKANDTMAFELSLERVDDADLVSAGIKFGF